MSDPLIRYACRAAAHQQTAGVLERANPASPVTYYNDAWAYCPAGASDGHQWEQITGTPMQEIRIRLAHAQRV